MSAVGGIGATNRYDFTQITGLQLQKAATDLEQGGFLTSDEASQLKGMGCASSFSPVDPGNLSSDTDWQKLKLNVLSDLQNEMARTGTGENIALSGTSSLLQKLSDYGNASSDEVTGSAVHTNA